MHTFAQKSKAPQQAIPAKPTIPGRAHYGHSQEVNKILHLQRTIGNQAVQRLLQANTEERNTGSATPTSSRFGHHFSRTPVHSSAPGGIQPKLMVNTPGDVYEQEADRIADQVMAMPAHPAFSGAPPRIQRFSGQSNEQTEAAPASVDQALASPGRPLEAALRQDMEQRFGHDFSSVRVHSGTIAEQSAQDVNAHAYTLGQNIVFGAGRFIPETHEGRRLLAHELAHVVQQRNAIDPHPVLRRAAKTAKTSAGEFVADPYDPMRVLGAGGITAGYGANITITFKANDRVDAEKIAFVQTALSMKDGKVHNRFDAGEKKKVNESRMIPSGKPGAGTHIDQLPDVRTPLYGMTGNRGDDLSEPEPAKNMKLTEIGWHYKDAGGNPQNHDAMMHDEPDLTSGDVYTKASDVMSQEWSQQFETSALAIAGHQKGTVYGSVEWGWKRSVSDERTHLSEFKTKSETVASPTFMEAAKLWNVSVTTEKKATIDLPVDVHVTSKSAGLWDSPDQGRMIATLTKDTPLGRTAKVDPKGRIWWASVIVTGGPNVGKTGWVKEVDLY